jgi:hypothetical protein
MRRLKHTPTHSHTAHHFGGALGALLLLLTAACGAATVTEQGLLLRNTLDAPRPAEVVVVTLRELGVPEAQARQVRDVEVLDDQGQSLAAQFDDFSVFPGGAAEVAFEIDLAPLAVQRVTVRLLDADRKVPDACTVSLDGDTAIVTTPVFTVPVRLDEATGLWVEQPRFTRSDAQKLDEAMDGMLAGLDAPAPLAKGAGVQRASGGMKPPMSDQGLPFCVQGYPTFGKREPLKAWGGPVRSVVCLADRGVWATGHAKTRYGAVQTLWFPRTGNRFFLDWRAAFDDPVPPGRIPLAGLRVNSADFPWDLIMGQDGRRPYVAPVIVPLANTTKQPFLEPYQKSTFNHVWAQAVSAKGWAAVVVDAEGSRFGATTNWGSGRVRLNVNMGYDDPGPFGNSLQPVVREEGLPAGSDYHLRAMVLFGGPGDAVSCLRAANAQPLARRWRQEAGAFEAIDAMRAAAAACLARPVVLPHRAVAQPAPDWARVKERIGARSVVVVTPDATTPEREALWRRLAAQLGGSCHPARTFLKHHNVTGNGRLDRDLLTVVVGEPGANRLLDQLNDDLGLFNTYPLDPPRAATVFIDEGGTEGALLVIAGNTEAATRQAVEQALAQLGGLPAREAAILSACHWGDRLPYAWSGLKPHAGSFRTTAWRNGRAEFLLLLRAGEALAGLKWEGPAGATVRFVPFRFESESAGETFVTALHDAAFPTLPATLAAGSLQGVWVSLPIPSDAQAGMRRDTARLAWAGGAREIVLETEVLPVVLSDRQALGFFPMGFDAESIRMYYGWDHETYLAKLPHLLKQLREFGNTTYNLDITGIKIDTDDLGQVTVDAGAFRRELEAVRAVGGIDLLMTDSFNYFWSKAVLDKIIRARKLADDFEAWEHVIPELRRTFRELGLEDKLVCRHGDEIPDYEGWLGRAELYKRCGVRMSVAINGYGVFNKHLAVGTMGFWIPLYNFYLRRWNQPIPDDDFECFSRNFRDARRAAGEPVWPYVCGPGPYAWSPRPRSQARFLMLDTYMQGADGLTYYGGMVWSHALDPAFRKSEKANLFDTDATFTTLFYPDAATSDILPSLRAGAFRLGLEDAAATQALRARAAAKGKAEAVEAEIEKAFAEITMDAGDEVFENYRRTLGRLWLELEK